MRRINKSRLVFFLLSAVLVVPLLSTTLFGAPPAGDGEEEGDSLYKYLSVFTEVLRLVRQVYVEEPDIRRLMSGALDGASDALDPFSMYVPAEGVASYLEAVEVGRGRSGIEILKERGVAYVAALEEGSPAESAGLERGDIVSKLQGLSTRAMPVWQIRQVLAGEPGSTVSMELVRRGETLEIDLELAEFESAAPSLESVRGVAVLRIPHFTPQTHETVSRLLAENESERLLIDLRGVSGGTAEAAYSVAEVFARGQLGVLTSASQGATKRFAGGQEKVWQGSLGVLVDRGSRGPSEILSAVLQQSAGATILGEETFGYAGEASRLRLASGGLLEVTEAYYTGPDGEALDESLEPDLEVSLPHGSQEEGDEDRVLGRALDLFLGEADAEVEKAA